MSTWVSIGITPDKILRHTLNSLVAVILEHFTVSQNT